MDNARRFTGAGCESRGRRVAEGTGFPLNSNLDQWKRTLLAGAEWAAGETFGPLRGESMCVSENIIESSKGLGAASSRHKSSMGQPYICGDKGQKDHGDHPVHGKKRGVEFAQVAGRNEQVFIEQQQRYRCYADLPG